MNYKYFLVGLLLLFSFLLRFHNYAVYPQRGATSDEYTYSFLGVSLLTQHKPISWSSFQAYGNYKNLTIDKIYFPIVEPYFDHPPLYGLLSGGWAILNHESTFESIKLSTIRLVPIALSLATTLLVFLIGSKLFGFKAGLWALLIFATTTTFVMNGRVAVSENLVAFWFALASYLYVLWHEKFTGKRIAILGLICGFSFLTQIISTALFFAILFMLILKRVNFKKLAFFVLPFLFCVGLYLLYGAYFNWNLFWQINLLQSARPIGPLTFWYIFSTPIIINKIYFDGWYLFSFLTLFLLFFDQKNRLLVLVPFFYILLLVLTLTEQGQSGWYIIPLFPFMALAAGKSLTDTIKEKNLFFTVFLFFTGLFEIHALYRDMFGLTNLVFRILIFILFAPFLLSFFPKGQRAYRIVSNICFYLLILGNAWLTWHYVHPS